MQRRGLRGLRRSAVAAALFPLVISGLALAGGSSFGVAADSTPPGVHEHHGAHGEVDVNVCADAVPAGYASCAARVRTEPEAQRSQPTPAAVPRAPSVTGVIGDGGAYSPAYLEAAYNAPSASRGAGQTVAVVDAFDSPTAASDLAYYRSYFGLPPCGAGSGCFRKVDQFGGTRYPASNPSWSQEIAIDLDMVSAMCPNCNILLVEANTASLSDLGSGVNTAAALGANVVANSYGGNEYPGETTDNVTYFRHPGVAVVAASGDRGYGVEFPASSADVVAVGGTTLTQLTTGGRNGSETAWSGGGSGCSAYVTKPSWQHDTQCARRTVTDVSAVADPSTGVWVWSSGSWHIFGGTSVAAPIIGAMYALAGNAVTPGVQPPSLPYRNPAVLNDVVSGSNGSCFGSYLCTAGPGYDGPTGLGTPNTAVAFSASNSPPPVTAPSAPTGLTAAAGDGAVQLSWTPPASTGGAAVTYSVYRGTASGAEAQVASGVGAPSFSDSGLSDGTTYFYQVKAVNYVGASPFSNETSATPVVASVLGAPRSLTASTAATRGVVLRWTAPATDGGSPVTGYRVYRGYSSGTEAYYTTVACTTSSCTFTDTSTHRTFYYYQVAAVTAAAVGPLSNQASALAR